MAFRHRLKRRTKCLQYVYDYFKTHPCVDCWENDPRVLEFDHVRGVKTAAISRLCNEGVKLERLQEEINKCDVRCANCHRRRTFQEGRWLEYIKIHIPPTRNVACPNCEPEIDSESWI